MTAYYEVEGWPRTKNTEDGAYAQRKLECAWDDRITVATEIDAYPARIFPYGNSGAQISQIAIIPAPKSKMGGTDDIASYDTAHLIVDYSTNAASTAKLISEGFSPSTVAMKYGHKGLMWEDETVLIDGESIVAIRGSMNYFLRYYRAAYVPASIGYAGYINNNNFWTKTLGLVFYPGALVYRGPKVVRTQTVSGVTMFDITHTFGYSPNGWNYSWRNETSQYEIPYDKVTGNPMLAHPNTAFSY